MDNKNMDMLSKTPTTMDNNVFYAKREKKDKRIKFYAMAFVWLVLLLMYVPVIYLVVFSFTNSKVAGVWTGFSTDAYTTLFSPSTNQTAQKIWDAAINTALVAIVSGILSTIVGTLGAIGMHYLNKKLRLIFDFATQIPVVNAEIVMGLSLCILFVFLNWERSFLTLVIGHMVLTIPFVVLNVQPRLQQMDPSLYEAAMDLGANRFQAMMRVVIPDLVPGILAGLMISVTLSLDDQIITAFTKPTSNGFHTISTYVDAVTKKAGLPIQLRAFTAILFLLIIFVMVALMIAQKMKKEKQSRSN